MYYNCSNCKKDLIEGDMCLECSVFLKPAEVIVPVKEETVKEKVVKAVKKATKKK